MKSLAIILTLIFPLIVFAYFPKDNAQKIADHRDFTLQEVHRTYTDFMQAVENYESAQELIRLFERGI